MLNTFEFGSANLILAYFVGACASDRHELLGELDTRGGVEEKQVAIVRGDKVIFFCLFSSLNLLVFGTFTRDPDVANSKENKFASLAFLV